LGRVGKALEATPTPVRLRSGPPPSRYQRLRKKDKRVSDTNSQAETQEFSAFLLALIRAEILRCDLDCTELKSVGIALKNGWIGPDLACAWLTDAGLASRVIGDEVQP
jgi:hypothetical protein